MLRSCFLALLTLICGWAHAGSAFADAEALRLLERIARAARETPYHGVYVQQRGGVIETYRLHHAQWSGVETERRQSLDGSAREMVRRGETVSLFLPEGMPQAVSRSMTELTFPQLPHGSAESIVRNYRIEPAGQARVAGQDAEAYLLLPRDKLRYPRKIWIHAQSGLLLKVALQSASREFEEVFAFSQIEPGAAVAPAKLQSTGQTPVATVQLRRSFPAAVAEPGWSIGALPEGYRLIRQTRRVMTEQPHPVIHHVYSDGLCSISIFLESWRDGMPHGLVHQGVTHILGRDVDGFHVTVVGDAPLTTIEKFSKAYQPNGARTKK